MNRTTIAVDEVSARDGFTTLGTFDLLRRAICTENALIGVEEVAVERFVARVASKMFRMPIFIEGRNISTRNLLLAATTHNNVARRHGWRRFRDRNGGVTTRTTGRR